jgi:hypothetical protein
MMDSYYREIARWIQKIQQWEHVDILRLALLFLFAFFIWIVYRKYIHRKVGKPLPKRYLPKKLRSRRFAYIFWDRRIYQRYLENLYKFEKVDKIRFFGAHAEEKLLRECYIPVQLLDVQTAQNTKTQSGKGDTLNKKDDAPKNIDIYTLIDNSSGNVLILGEPGAGKTTLAKFLALRLLEPNQTELDQHASYRQIRGRDVKEWFPIFINLERDTILIQFASSQVSKVTTEADDQTTLKFIDLLALHVFWGGDLGQIQDKGKLVIAKQYATPLLIQLLNIGAAFIIIDGLEHLSAWQASEDVKRFFANDLGQFAKDYCKDANNFMLMTARDGDVNHEFSQWDQYKLLPLTSTSVRKQHFLKHYLSEEKANELTQEIVKYPRINDMAQNPLLLSLIAYIYQRQNHKPEFARVFNRVQLYEQLVEGLWERWGFGYSKLKSSSRDEVLCNLAYGLLKKRRFTFWETELEESIKQVLGIQTNEQDSIKKTKDDLDNAGYLYPIQQRILSPRWGRKFWNNYLPLLFSEWKPVEGSLTFIHFTFQEFFTSLWLSKNSANNIERELLIRLRDPWWQESLSMYISRQPNAPDLVQKYLQEKKIIERIGQRNQMDRSDRVHLLDTLCEMYNLEELKTLCYRLDVQYENLGGEGKKGKARELILDLERNRRVSKLFEQIYSQQIGHDIRDLFLLARILQEYTHLPDYDQIDESTKLKYDQVQEEVYAQMLALIDLAVTNEDITALKAQLNSVSGLLPGAGDFFFKTDKGEIESRLGSKQPDEKQLLILTLCAKVGDKPSMDTLLKQFRETSSKKVEEGVKELLREFLHNPELYLADELSKLLKTQLANNKRGLILDLLASSHDQNLLQPLVNLAKEENKADIRKSIVSLVYDQQLTTLSSPFYRYLLNPMGPDAIADCKVIHYALQENADQVMEALVARLLSYTCTRLHHPIRYYLSSLGSSHKTDNTENYLNILLLLLRSNQKEEGLRILANIDQPEWASELLVVVSQKLPYKDRSILINTLRIMPQLDHYYQLEVMRSPICIFSVMNSKCNLDSQPFALTALQDLSKHDRCWYLRFKAKWACVAMSRNQTP